MMHGPFLFHANALIYFLFGDNDFHGPDCTRPLWRVHGHEPAAAAPLARSGGGYHHRHLAADLALVSLLLALYPQRHLYRRLDHRAHCRPLSLHAGAASRAGSIWARRCSCCRWQPRRMPTSLASSACSISSRCILWERVSRRNQLWLYIGGAALSLVLLLAAYFLGRSPGEAAEAAEGVAGVPEASTKRCHRGGRHSASGPDQRQSDPLSPSHGPAASKRRSVRFPGRIGSSPSSSCLSSMPCCSPPFLPTR